MAVKRSTTIGQQGQRFNSVAQFCLSIEVSEVRIGLE
jgi:hypothetical protein